MNPNEMLFVVACKSLHRALGPFLGLRSALLVCRELNEKGECTYLPVPFEAEFKLVPAEGEAKPKAPDNRDHGYL